MLLEMPHKSLLQKIGVEIIIKNEKEDTSLKEDPSPKVNRNIFIVKSLDTWKDIIDF